MTKSRSRIFFSVLHSRGTSLYTAVVPASFSKERILQLIKNCYLGRAREGDPTKKFEVRWLLINPRIDSMWYTSDWAEINL
jgi:hypothetical protein